jgi:hypothetical protein
MISSLSHQLYVNWCELQSNSHLDEFIYSFLLVPRQSAQTAERQVFCVLSMDIFFHELYLGAPGATMKLSMTLTSG